jgi:hypothetical protein
MKTPHKHTELIKQWADGAQIEFYDSRLYDSPQSAKWQEIDYPDWNDWTVYRVKPEQKPDKILYGYIKDLDSVINKGLLRTVVYTNYNYRPKLRLPNFDVEYTIDGNTGKLKSIKMI